MHERNCRLLFSRVFEVLIPSRCHQFSLRKLLQEFSTGLDISTLTTVFGDVGGFVLANWVLTLGLKCLSSCFYYRYVSVYLYQNTIFKNFLLEDFIYLFLVRGEGSEKEGGTSMCGCLLCAPYWGPGPQPRHVPWLGIQSATLCFAVWRSIHWATPARAPKYYFSNCIPQIISNKKFLAQKHMCLCLSVNKEGSWNRPGNEWDQGGNGSDHIGARSPF